MQFSDLGLKEYEGILHHYPNKESAVKTVLWLAQREFGTLSGFIWAFVNHKPIQNRWKSMKKIPTETIESQDLSKELKKRGFTFVGPTICYAFMQAVGMVNDHEVGCFRYRQVLK